MILKHISHSAQSTGTVKEFAIVNIIEKVQTLDYITGLDYWTRTLDLITGLEHWNSLLDWNTGMD